MYNTMQYSNENTTDYLVSFRNSQNVNEACNGILIISGIKGHGMKITFLLQNTGFDYLQEDKKKEA